MRQKKVKLIIYFFNSANMLSIKEGKNEEREILNTSGMNTNWLK